MILHIANLTKRRVVITGMGAATAFGNNLENIWNSLMEGKSAISKIESFDTSELSCKIAGSIKIGTGDNEIDLNKYVDLREQKRSDRFMYWGYIAAADAIKDANIMEWLSNLSESEKLTEQEKIGILVGSGIGGLGLIEKTTLEADEITKGKNTLSEAKINPVRNPFFIPASLINLLSGNISVKYGFKGPNHAVVTACATGAHAIGDAARLVALGDANIMVAGGAEGAICKIGIAGFDVMKALSSKYNDNPENASRPWDKDRDGFVMGEGAGILILEELEHALKRGAPIYGEIVGYGLTGDAYHMSAPHPEGEGGARAMMNALKSANLSIEEIDYLNAHGTSTPMGDLIELKAIRKLFAHNPEALKKLLVSSTKSSIGHLLGAAGAVESIFSILAMNKSEVPPTLNLKNREEEAQDFDLNEFVPGERRKKNIDVVVSNSFGFGGTNACVIFKKYKN